MDDAPNASCDLSALAPPIEAGEAISSWLARTADTHLLTLAELQREIGGSIAALDRGDFTLLPRVARMTGVSLETLFRMVHSQFIAEPARPGPPPPETWAVCPELSPRRSGAGKGATRAANLDASPLCLLPSP